MSSVKISGLPAASALDGGETVPVVQNGETRRAEVSLFSAYASGTGSFLLPANNLSDVADDATAVENIGAAYNVSTLADLKGLTSRPAKLIADGSPWTWYAGDVTADNSSGTAFGTVVECTSGPAGRYKRDFVGSVSVLWMGAARDWNGTTGTDNTAAFRRAIATGYPVYAPGGLDGLGYLIEDILTLGNSQDFFGDSDTGSVIFVKSTANLSALGIVRLATSETGASIRNIGITFVQPDTAVRANLIAYPPAIYAKDAPRFVVENVRITAGRTGIEATGNTGGALVRNLKSSCFDVGVNVDGAQHTFTIEGADFWVYGLTANQMTIMADGVSRGVSTGRADAFDYSNVVGLTVGDVLDFHVSSDGASVPQGVVRGVLGSDGRGTIRMSAGKVAVAGLRAGLGNAADYIVKQSGGSLTIVGADVFTNQVQTNPLFTLNTLSTGSASSIAGTVLTVDGTITGIWEIGQAVGGAGVSANTVITGNARTEPGVLTGTGGAGTYRVNNSQTVGAVAMLTGEAGAIPVGPVSLTISGLHAQMNSHDNTLIYVDGGSDPNFSFHNMFIERDAGTAYSDQTILINTGRGDISGLSTLTKGAGAGVLLQINTANSISLTGINRNGWTVTLPAGQVAQTVYGDFLFPDATYDIGKSGATRPRDYYGSRVVSAGTQFNIGSAKIIDVVSSAYAQFWDGAGTHNGLTIYADANYHNSADHTFRAKNASTLFANIKSDGITIASGLVLKIGTDQVVGARKTGWATMTGTATRTAFDTSTATATQVAERLKALIDDLHATAGHGLLGT